MSNFVHVGKVTIPVDPPRSPDAEVYAEMVVGVMADTGKILVQTGGKNGAPWPRLTTDAALVLADLLRQAAAKAPELAEAYRTYRRALVDAEIAFGRAMGAADQ